MIRAMPAITRAAATKIAISSALESPPLLVAGAGVGTVTGPVWVVVGVVVVVLGIGVVGSVVSGAVLVAVLLALAAGTITRARKSAPRSRVATRARLPLRPNRGARAIVAI
jgi:hypothetical protein